MQSLYANCMVQAKAADCGCLHVYVEETGEFNCHKTIDSFYFTSQLQTYQNIDG